MQMLKEPRFDFFSIKQRLEQQLHDYVVDKNDIDNNDVIDMQIIVSDSNHDLTKEATDLSLKKIAGWWIADYILSLRCPKMGFT